MKVLLAFVLLINTAYAQTSYTGFIDRYPIELVASVYSDGVANAIYAYSNFDTPISVNGIFKNNILTLDEKDTDGQPSASLSFPDYDVNKKTLIGTWRNLRTGNELKVTLKREFAIEDVMTGKISDVEMIQGFSLKDQYFRVVVSESKGYPHVSGVKIFAKRTDELQQSIEMDCQFIGLSNVEVGDYNFDGIQDFSVFEKTYSGANNSRLYFLYNPRRKYFFNSGFQGVSLTFDEERKMVTETNECCGGTQKSTILYRVVDNKMVEVERHCFVWEESSHKLIESGCK